MFPPSRIVLEIQILEGTSVNTDDVAHDEPPHLDLLFLQIQIQSNFNGSNTFGTMKISWRQG